MSKKSRYLKFLQSKIQLAKASGFEVKRETLPDTLLPHAKDTVVWACGKGKAAVFSAFGMTKTRTNIAILQAAKARDPHSPVLVICPLGVKSQFQNNDGPVMGVRFEYIRNREEQYNATSDYHITNYERILEGDFDLTIYSTVALDEGAKLRNSASETTRQLFRRFKNTTTKLVFTAIPAPNDYIEYLNYAEFLGVMDRGQAKTRFFVRDSEKADNLTLNPKHEADFWLWVHSWALFLEKPSDLGYSDEGYDLPEMVINWHEVSMPRELYGDLSDRDGQYKLMAETANSLPEEAKIKRATVDIRIAKAKEIIEANPDEHFLIWHLREDERDRIEKTIPGVVTLYGSQDLDTKEDLIADFSAGKIKLFAPKPEICGSGPNFQYHCHRAIYASIDHRFHDFLNSVYRIYRFRQSHQVTLDIIYSEAERGIAEDLKEKWAAYKNSTNNMSALIRAYGLNRSNANGGIKRTFGCQRKELKGKSFTAVCNDSVEEYHDRKSNSTGLIVTSIPFSNQYEYVASYNDFGHNMDNDHFWKQMDFLIPQLYRVLQPGRLCCVHVKDRLIPGNYSGLGFYTVYSLGDDARKHFKKYGFEYVGKHTITTDVVRENNQNYRLSWSENCKDGTKMGAGLSEEVLLFRKPPTDLGNSYADLPVAKSKGDYTRARWQIDAHGFWRSNGDRLLTPDEIARLDLKQAMRYFNNYSFYEVYDYGNHIKIAQALEDKKKLPSGFMAVQPQSWNTDVWTDITRMRTLNTMQGQKGEEKHVCPFQFDIVERLIYRYSNKGEQVDDCFAGFFTVPLMAAQMGRIGWGCEFGEDIWNTGCTYLKEHELKHNMPTLFNLVKQELEVNI